MNDIDEILKEKLDEIVQENGFTSPKVTVSKAMQGGYIGIPSKILIEDEQEGTNKKPLYLFLKAAPGGEIVRQTMPMRSVFVNEIYLYTEVLPTYRQFQKEKGVRDPFDSIPKCYKTSLIDGHEFLIFEDLWKSGYTLWEKTKPMTPENVEFVLKETAKYHAISFAFQDQRPDKFKMLISKLGNTLEDLMKTPVLLPMFINNAEIALKCLDPIKDDYLFKIFDNFVRNELQRLVLSFPIPKEAIIIHGDSWCNNFMFRFEDAKFIKIKKMAFLDWQCARYSTPVVDLSYFLYCNGPQEVLDDLNRYLQIYHSALCSSIKEMGSDPDSIFPFSTLKEHWKKYSKFGLIMACTLLNACHNENHTQIESVGDMLEKGKDFAESFDESLVLDNLEYRTRMRAVIKHFINNQFI